MSCLKPADCLVQLPDVPSVQYLQVLFVQPAGKGSMLSFAGLENPMSKRSGNRLPVAILTGVMTPSFNITF